jgi:hypothetical protein
MQYSFVTTEDGSPTLRFGSGENLSEAMHSLKGAFSETAYIYGSAIDRMLEEGFQPRVLSLGLGLGYVELLAAGLALKKASLSNPEEAERIRSRFGGESFEIVSELRDWFTLWLETNEPTTDEITADPLETHPLETHTLDADKKILIPEEFKNAYSQILERTAVETSLPSREIKAWLAELVRTDRWRIRPALDHQTSFADSFGCICFDAFSSKTSPDLWTEDFLLAFFQKTAAQGAVLSTYACTGALKRSLRRAGFDLMIREGFSSKRDSTFAIRPSSWAKQSDEDV